MWPDSSQTQELLSSAGRGDPDAVNQLLDRHRQALHRMIGMRLDARLSKRIDASDIVQEVLIEANRRLASYLKNPVMPFHLWLRHMARDRVIDAHRRHRVAAKRSVEREQPLVSRGRVDQSTMDLAAQLVNPELTPAAAATWKEMQLRFAAAVELLDESDRDVILMRHFEQLSNQEVAQALGLTQPAAGMRYLRAIRRLREMLDDPSSTGDD